jgi:phosphoribosylanthranilate isomerase
MSLWIKICGNTSAADALLAVDAGADAVGFVFAPSPRHVSESEVAGIVARLPKTVETIGVFVDATVEEIYSAVRMCHLTGVQLHWDAAADVPGRLKARLGRALRVLRVVHFGEGVAERAAAYERDPNVDGLLIDSRTAAAAGGTGVAYDWKLAGFQRRPGPQTRGCRGADAGECGRGGWRAAAVGGGRGERGRG